MKELTPPSFSEQVKFRPWVGENYFHTKPRILMLGESHYGVDIDEPEFTTEMIKRQFGEGQDAGFELDRYDFPKAVERIFSGKHDLTETCTKAFWGDVALYNFVQAYLKDRSVRPTPRQFSSSVTQFCEVVTALEPDVIVVFGIETWNHLPNGHELTWRKQDIKQVVTAPIRSMKRSLEVWKGSASYHNQTHVFWSFFFPHPAAHGFGSADGWYVWRETALTEIAELGVASA